MPCVDASNDNFVVFLQQHHGKDFDQLNREFKAQLAAVNHGNNKKNGASSRYKTELCRPYEEFSSCKYGDKCQFAHGHHELRTLTRHPKYKTELCRTFHTLGLCPYGHRCHFIHNEAEYFEEVVKRQAIVNQLHYIPPLTMDYSNGSSGSSSPTNTQVNRLPVFWNLSP